MYADSAIVMAIRSSIPDSIAHAYQWMYQIHMATKNYQKALSDFRLATEYRASAQAIRQNNADAQLREIHQKETSLFREEILELKKMTERERRNAITIFFALLIFLIIVIYIFYRKNSQLESDLERSGTELAMQSDFRRKLYSILSKDAEHSLMAINDSTLLLSSTSHTKLAGEDEIVFSQIQQHVHHLQITLNHVIQWLGYQSNEKAVIPEEFDCKALADEVISRFQVQISEKHLITDMFLPAGQIAYADKSMIEIVLENLISNAIRYTTDGGRLTLFSGTKDDLVTMGIKDSGIGISEEHRQRLFNILQEAGADGQAENQGSGIGLVLSRDFVERNGGRMYVESVEGEGSTFYFSLPGKKIG